MFRDFGALVTGGNMEPLKSGSYRILLGRCPGSCAHICGCLVVGIDAFPAAATQGHHPTEEMYWPHSTGCIHDGRQHYSINRPMCAAFMQRVGTHG